MEEVNQEFLNVTEHLLFFCGEDRIVALRRSQEYLSLRNLHEYECLEGTVVATIDKMTGKIFELGVTLCSKTERFCKKLGVQHAHEKFGGDFPHVPYSLRWLYGFRSKKNNDFEKMLQESLNIFFANDRKRFWKRRKHFQKVLKKTQNRELEV